MERSRSSIGLTYAQNAVESKRRLQIELIPLMKDELSMADNYKEIFSKPKLETSMELARYDIFKQIQVNNSK